MLSHVPRCDAGSLSSHITAGNVADQEYNRQMESVREFLRQREVPLKQRRKVMAFYQNYLKRQTVRLSSFIQPHAD
eukprot:SAG11_NODE_253_length_11591_cov_15.933693_4_plen_76_part_00